MTKKVVYGLFSALIAMVFNSSPALAQAAKWVEQTQFNADMRYRMDWLKEDVNGANRDPRYRHRLRARVGFHTEVEPQWSLGARIATVDGAATSGGDPVSYNQTLDDNGSKKMVGWDLAYIQWKNETGWMAKAGKIVNPIYTPQGSQLIFDQDYTPEGVALQTPWFVTTGYILDERALATGSTTKKAPDAWLWATQTHHNFNVADRKLLAGVGYYHFFNLEGHSNLYTTNTTFPFLSNSSVASSSTYEYEYRVAQLFGEFQLLKDQPLVAFADVIQNLAASRGNFGWLAGLKYGKMDKAGSWDAMYFFRRTDTDSTVSALNDSDFAGGRDQAYGHVLNGRYALTDKVKLGLTYIKAAIGPTHSDDYDRVFIDFNMSL